MGILRIRDLNKGMALKQGDKTTLKFELYDANDDPLVLSSAGKVYFKQKGQIYAEEDVTITTENVVSFKLNTILPAGKYYVEFVVDDKVFPSQDIDTFHITSSVLGDNISVIAINGIDRVAERALVLIEDDLQAIEEAELSRAQAEEARETAEGERETAEGERETAEGQRKADHANRSAEFDSKADKVVIKNLVENGDFSQGTTGWEFGELASDMVVSDGVSKIGTRYVSYSPYYSITIDKNKKYFISSKIKNIDSASVLIPSYALTDGNSTLSKSQFMSSYSDEIDTEKFSRVSRVVTANNNYTSIALMKFQANSGSARYAYFDDLIFVNLTDTFGAGNEPTKEEMDELIKVTGYIDGEYALNNKEMLGYLINSIGEFPIVKSKSEEAITKANQADSLSKSVQSQFNQVVIDGDSSVESAQARVDTSGHANATLKERLDKEHTEVTSHLAETTDNLKGRSINVKAPPTPLLGAVGDGITDDTIAIKEMIDYVKAEEGSLFFPTGNYLITSSITIPRGVSFIGVNNRLSNLQFNGTGALLQFEYRAGYVKLYNLNLEYLGTDEHSIGVLLEANLLCTANNIRIQNFGTGVRIDGKDRWSASNTFYDIDTLRCFYGIHITADSGKQSNHNNFFGGYLYGEPTLKEGSKGIFIERGDSNTFFGTAVEEFDVGYHFKAQDSGGSRAFAPRAEACNTNFLIESTTTNTQLFGPLSGQAVEHGIRNLSQTSSIYTREPTFVGNNLYWGSGDGGSLKFLSGGVPKTVLKQEDGNMEFYSPGVYSRDYKFNIRDSAQVNREEFTISTGKIRTRVDFEIGGTTASLPEPSEEFRGRIKLIKSTTHNEPDRLFICVKKPNAGLDEFEWKEL